MTVNFDVENKKDTENKIVGKDKVEAKKAKDTALSDDTVFVYENKMTGTKTLFIWKQLRHIVDRDIASLIFKEPNKKIEKEKFSVERK